MEPGAAESRALGSKNDRDLIRRWVDTWRSAGRELEAIRRHDISSVPVPEAVRQLFEGMDSVLVSPAPAASGLVEQQMWFSRIRAASGKAADPETGE
jgi:hypothetical protein